MKLLLDQNLSFRLALRLNDLFPGSEHVRNIGLAASDDTVIWEYAGTHGYAIVSKDSDFYQRSLVHGHPPKVVWVRRGNCSTTEVEAIIRRHSDDILAFDKDSAAAFLVLV